MFMHKSIHRLASKFFFTCGPLPLFFLLLFAAPKNLCSQEDKSDVYSVEQVPNVQLQDSTAFVSDPNGYLTSPQRENLDVRLQALRRQLGVEFVIVLLPQISDDTVIEDFALNLFRSWGLGSSKDNSGLLLLAVMNSRKVRIQTGYGLEGVLPDAICSNIIYDKIRPAFKEGDYYKGLDAAVTAVEQTLQTGAYEGATRTDKAGKKEEGISTRTALWGAYLFFTLFIALMMLISMDNIRRINKNPKLIGSQKLQASDKLVRQASLVSVIVLCPLLIPFLLWYNSYRKRIKAASLVCPKCGESALISLQKESPDFMMKLSSSQQFEENLHSVEYGVDTCNNCHSSFVYVKNIPTTQYSLCKKCGTRAVTTVGEQIFREGNVRKKRVFTKCLYCHNEHFTDHVEEEDSTKAIVAGAILGSLLSSSGRGGGFGGGGFGGGGFGGGSTGGGGATGGW